MQGALPSARWLPLLALFVFLSGCDDRALQQRAEQIRELSEKQDRAYRAEALNQVLRDYWTLRDGSWYGKLPDGTIVELKSRHATPAVLPLVAPSRGWHLQLTISSDDWRTYPESRHEEHFAVVYAITRQNATSWYIRVIDGRVTSPLQREDVPKLQAD